MKAEAHLFKGGRRSLTRLSLRLAPAALQAGCGAHSAEATAAMDRGRKLRPCLGLPFLKADVPERRGEGHFREGEVGPACPPVYLSLNEVDEGVL